MPDILERDGHKLMVEVAKVVQGLFVDIRTQTGKHIKYLQNTCNAAIHVSTIGFVTLQNVPNM